MAAGLEVERVGVATVTHREIAEAVELTRRSGGWREHRDTVRRTATTKRVTFDEMAALAAEFGRHVALTSAAGDNNLGGSV